MIYEIKHDDNLVARVEITDAETTRTAIKEMVELWAWWKTELAKDGGDYTRCWLRKLAQYILHNGQPPRDEEGWYPLDGSMGIKLLNFWTWEFDYLKLLRPPAGMEKSSRENQVAELSRRLKAISKDCKFPILLLAKLNRESEKENRAPRMSDLRESGAIEQDSDRILFLHRDDPDQQSRVILTQAKLRSGPCMVSRVCTLAGAIYKLTPE